MRPTITAWLRYMLGTSQPPQPAEDPRPPLSSPPRHPPTPDETAKAVVQLRVLRSHIDDYYVNAKAAAKSKDKVGPAPDISALTKATFNLRKAMALDPDAVLLVETKDGPHTYTQNALAAELLYLEAEAYDLNAENISAQMDEDTNAYNALASGDRSVLRDYQRKWDKDFATLGENRRLALEALRKAITYSPGNPDLYVLAAKISSKIYEQKDAARQYAREALRLAPDNIDAIKCAQDLGIL
jgi:tetratricopeptide (TPR) repeat protein